MAKAVSHVWIVSVLGYAFDGLLHDKNLTHSERVQKANEWMDEYLDGVTMKAGEAREGVDLGT